MTAPNRSAAVMAQRHEPSDSLDCFPTPPWAVRALCEVLEREFPEVPLCDLSVLDPACGPGHMTRPLAEFFGRVRGTDVFDYAANPPAQVAEGFRQDGVADFLWPDAPAERPDWIVTNPPFRLAEDFLRVALDRARIGVAFLVRVAFLEGQERHGLFADHPPRLVLPFSERVLMFRGVVREPGRKYFCPYDEKVKTPSGATAYCWLVWRTGPRGNARPELDWIAPCSTRLTRPGDYPPIAEPEGPPLALFEGGAP